MLKRRSFFALAAALTATVLSGMPLVNSQQTPGCAATQTAGKTDRQLQLEDCHCEQAAAAATTQDKPTYRVGAAPFGRTAAARAGGAAARRGAAAEPENLNDGLEVPDLKDLRSPEVVGLREQVLRVREEARQKVEKSWRAIYRRSFEREIERRGYFKRTDEFFKAEPLKGSPEDYLKPEVYAEVLAYLREHGHQFARLEREYQRLEHIHDLDGGGATLPRFDWRGQGLNVGGVMNQGKCNSCWAFVAASAYQSSWNLEEIRTGKYFSDVLSSDEPHGQLYRFASVQQLLNCIGEEKGSCSGGGWHGTAFAFMVGSHVPHILDSVVERRITDPRLVNDPRGPSDKIEVEGYTGKYSVCVNPFRRVKVGRGGSAITLKNAGSAAVRLRAGTDSKTTNYDRALAWGYVNEGKPNEMPSVAQLKQALIEHGPLAMPIHLDNCFTVYQGGVFNGRSTGDPNHVLVLIGWDDEKQAWLVKNSWGEAWGEKGFGWVAYGSNDIGHFAAWIQPTPETDRR